MDGVYVGPSMQNYPSYPKVASPNIRPYPNPRPDPPIRVTVNFR